MRTVGGFFMSLEELIATNQHSLYYKLKENGLSLYNLVGEDEPVCVMCNVCDNVVASVTYAVVNTDYSISRYFRNGDMIYEEARSCSKCESKIDQTTVIFKSMRENGQWH